MKTTKYCPVCSSETESFLPGGVQKRPDVKCPKCLSRERYRLLVLYLKNETDFFNKRFKVLEVCPEGGFQDLCKSLKNIDYVSIDLYRDNVDFKMDVTNLKFENETFDYIICYQVLEHVKDDHKAISELVRVLKPAGTCFVTCPVDIDRKNTFQQDDNLSEQENERLYGQTDHVRTYGIDFAKILKECGFNVTVEKYIEKFSNNEIEKFGLKDEYDLLLYRTNEDIYICKK